MPAWGNRKGEGEVLFSGDGGVCGMCLMPGITQPHSIDMWSRVSVIYLFLILIIPVEQNGGWYMWNYNYSYS